MDTDAPRNPQRFIPAERYMQLKQQHSMNRILKIERYIKDSF